MIFLNIGNNKMIKEKYKQLLLPRQFGGITTMLLHNHSTQFKERAEQMTRNKSKQGII